MRGTEDLRPVRPSGVVVAVIGVIGLLACFFYLLHWAWLRQEEISNPSLPIVPQEMFKKDGCTMYRFLDGGNYHYYSDCPSIKVLE
jgi:hypothetical protein